MRVHITLIAILLAFLVYLLSTVSDEPVGEFSNTSNTSTQDYDYFLSQLDTVHFSLNGEPQYRIVADRLTHYPETDNSVPSGSNIGFSTIEMPDFTLYRNDTFWHITAETGKMQADTSRNEDRLDLSDNVIIHHVNAEGRALNIYTEFLSIFPDSNNILTDRDITMEMDNIKYSSTGMNADLNANLIELLGNVIGRFN